MKKRIVFLLAAVGFLFLCGSAENAFAAEGVLDVQKVKPGRFCGFVSDSAGEKIAGKKILVVNSEGKVVASSVSNKYGMYQINNLPEGDYVLKLGDKEVTKLQVTREATVSSLKIVIPAKESWYSFSPLQWTLIGVGGTAVAVGVPLAAGGGSSSGGHGGVPPLSP